MLSHWYAEPNALHSLRRTTPTVQTVALGKLEPAHVPTKASNSLQGIDDPQIIGDEC